MFLNMVENLMAVKTSAERDRQCMTRDVRADVGSEPER